MNFIDKKRKDYTKVQGKNKWLEENFNGSSVCVFSIINNMRGGFEREKGGDFGRTK